MKAAAKQVVTVLFLLISSVAFAQKDNKTIVEGRVYELDLKDSVAPLPGANIHFPGTTIGVSTDSVGYFKLANLNHYKQIVVTFIGFEPDTIDIPKRKKMLNIVLKDGSILPGVEVLVKKGNYTISKFAVRNAHTMNTGELRKAACCNLAESFETNPSIDASFTDAITGTKQIQMLGLSGKYVQIMQDNIPMIRGLSTIYGFEYVPGSWINSVQVSKGTGSVVNGYESMTGQINLDWKKPGNAEKLHLNLFGNQAGRMELNLNLNRIVSKKWESTLLMHAKYQALEIDNNTDGFLDRPLTENFIIHNQWDYTGQILRMEYGVGALSFSSLAGKGVTDKQLAQDNLQNPYKVSSTTNRGQAFAKIGYLFPNEQYKSMAVQFSGVYHNHQSLFGNRQYLGNQTSGYANFIYQDEMGKKQEQNFKTGVSLVYDLYQESLQNNDTSIVQQYNLEEIVPGAYFEYNLTKSKLGLVAGVRADYHSVYGAFITPRVNMRYNFTEKNALKLSAGRGRRTPNLIMENVGLLATSRNWIIENDVNLPGFGLKQESAWNFGLGFNQDFEILFREGNINVDFYHTLFENQIIVDLDYSPQEVYFYNLEGQSFSNSFQIEVNYDISKRMDIRLAYRFLDVQKDFKVGMLSKPLLAQNKGFVNLSYETKKNDKEGQWKFDVTSQLVGEQRIPSTDLNPSEFIVPSKSPAYLLLSAQITKVFSKKFEFYIGGENLTNFIQKDPIIQAENPYGEYFDSSLIWAPVFGRMVYGGLRWTIE
ncbi:TonB-dependent receptor [Flavobacteriales bacterium]|nr:TonB-dependent receptor [Flavobacteriales bacterium]